MNRAITSRRTCAPVRGIVLEPGEPLWKRVPTCGEDGRPLSDFMMLIPKLRTWGPERVAQTLDSIQEVFDHYRDAVVFADLNLRLNLLWVSVRPIAGICLEIAAALNARVPEAVLVAAKPEAMMGQRRSFWRSSG